MDRVELARADRIAKHLETCRRCGFEADIYTKIKTRLAQQGEPVDPAVVERLTAFGTSLLDRSPKSDRQ